MIIVHTRNTSATFAMRHDTASQQVYIFIGRMDGGTILPRVSTQLDHVQLQTLIERLQDLYHSLLEQEEKAS